MACLNNGRNKCKCHIVGGSSKEKVIFIGKDNIIAYIASKQ
jgi:hypothetical protein